jgi:hypothetical protein
MRIGIITIHKISNYGSVLQAYALQKYIQQLIANSEVEIIDYVYPNKYHKEKRRFIKWLKSIFRVCRDYLFRGKWFSSRRFAEFRSKYLNLTSQTYQSIRQIQTNPPCYDLYITGSDQVWNVETLKNDPTMYCVFAPVKSKKIAFGASFAINSLPEKFCIEIKNRLSNYSYIGVREKSGFEILEKLDLPIHIQKMCTCDPTLLLTANDYNVLAQQSKIQINRKYILVYILGYAYSPEPAISIIAEKLAKQLNYEIIVLGSVKFNYKGKCKRIYGCGPYEFLSLFQHASFVLTSSFHGTMFSLIYRIPFISVLPLQNHTDSRIKDVLSIVGLEQRGIFCTDTNPIINISNPYGNDFEVKFNDYVRQSKDFLQRAVNTL